MVIAVRSVGMYRRSYLIVMAGLVPLVSGIESGGQGAWL
jgi:hypothetical protein